jgi:amino acid permease
MRSGGLISSTISIVAATVGSGNISLAYAFMKNGYILGMMTIIIGAMLSFYTGMLIVRCSHYTGKLRYEDIASSIYG